MEDILFAIMMLAIFAFGYFVVDRFGRSMNRHYRAYPGSSATEKNIYVTDTKGKSAEAVSKEVGTLLDSLPDYDDYEIIVCKMADSGVIRCLEKSGYTVTYLPRK